MRQRRLPWIVWSGLAVAVIAIGIAGCSTSYAPAPHGVLSRQALRIQGDVANARFMAPAGSLPSLDEEVWVIVRPKTTGHAPDHDIPGCGAMLASVEQREVPVPLKHTDVSASVSAYIATVDVVQQFHNPFDSKIEAAYVFPLPQNAAINQFVMTIGPRRIRGIIREREEAEKIYAESKRQGYVASLLTQERPNIFTQKVANIEPGRAIDVHIRYFQTLAYEDGWYRLVFPMVVGPRFNPPGHTDGIGAVARGGTGRSRQGTEVTYLRPGERSGHDIDLSVQIDAGVPIERVRCDSHRIVLTESNVKQRQVRLADSDRIPNRDFVLRWQVGGERIKADMLVHRPEPGDNGYFTLMVYPPQFPRDAGRHPLEMVFVIDCSGSMSGKPIAQAKTAIDRALSRLQPTDTFQVIRFSNSSSTFGPRPVPATRTHVRRARRFVRNLDGGGGTMMIEGIKAALDFDHDPERLRFVVFATDGFIGNDREILGEVHHRIGSSRIFSFGVGSAPNRYLMNRMARIGHGAVAYLPLDADAGRIMDDFMNRIAHPAMTDVRVDWGSLDVTDVYPRRVPDLFVGRPLLLTGRIRNRLDVDPTVVRVTGTAGANEIEIALRVSQDAARGDHPSLPVIWARRQIADLYDRDTWDPAHDLKRRITDVALNHNLMSAYTAFIAVDASRRTAGSFGTTVPVTVPVPEGVRYETTVSE
ncbi:MAG: trypsin [Phycisphaeraceae bacterium]|nr:trypsin [Phycisphaeraceae bacterium]